MNNAGYPFALSISRRYERSPVFKLERRRSFCQNYHQIEVGTNVRTFDVFVQRDESMTNANRSLTGFRSSLRWIAFVWLALAAVSGGQEKRVQPANAGQDAVIRVGVKEVRLDAVAVDANGRQITDLTADDFEIFQDGQPQKIVSSIYIADRPALPENKAASPEGSRATQSTPAPAPLQPAVGRTIVFLIDDLSMSFQDLHFARMCLQKFVQTQMQTGDRIAIVQTTKGNSGLQRFSSDKEELFARIADLGWSLNLHPEGASQFAALAYGLRALRDVAGRKFLFLISTQVMLPEKIENDTVFNKLADEALRAGVVVHTLDILGGINNQFIVGTDIYKNANDRAMDAEVRPLYGSISPNMESIPSPGEIAQAKNLDRIDAAFGPKQAEIGRTQAKERITNRESPLSQKTGGLFLTGSNFFLNGIGAAEGEMRGYYLISYVPPAETFDSQSLKTYHKVRIKVKRSGITVRTRDGFYGNTDALRETEQNPLMNAIFSPYRYGDLKLQMASGFVHAPQSGYLLRAWLLMDGQRLGVMDEKDGRHFISLEAVAATTDIYGSVQDSGTTKIGFRVNDREIQSIRTNGIRFFLSLAVKEPGARYLRIAVKDNASGAIGSAYQFIEIPELEKSGMALSSIFLLNRDEDGSWIQSGATGDGQGWSNTSQRAARRSQAVRTFQAGESFDYMAVVYNPKAKEEPPDLEFWLTLYGNGNEIFKSGPETVDVRGARDFSKIAIRKRLKLENSLLPGDYVLQLQVRDKKAGDASIAVQALDFKIAAKLTDTAVAPPPQQASSNAKNRTVIEMTTAELRRFDPELSSLQLNQGQDELSDLLEKAGDRVVTFFRDFPNTSSKEQIHMQRYLSENQTSKQRESESQPALLDTAGTGPVAAPLVDPRGVEFCNLLHCVPGDRRSQCVQLGCSKIETPEIHKSGPATALLQEYYAEFNFFILPGSKSAGISWVEDRSDKDNHPVNPQEFPGFILSSGHTLHCMYLHPDHQANSKFRYLGREKRKPYAHVIAFAQKPESRDYLAQFSDVASAAPTRFLVQGLIWIDPDNYQILRIRTSMLTPERQTTLKETVTDISYGRIQFDDPPREFWLPREINVSWEFSSTDKLDLVYRNQHKYSDYRLFSVKSDYKITVPKAGE